MGGRKQRTGRSAEELASLAERMGYMQAMRAAFAVIVLASAWLFPKVLGASFEDLVFVTAAYLVLSASVEGLRRAFGRRGIAVVEGMLLVDAVYLALVGYATGATESPLRFLVYVHLIGVTLLASYRTGMKIVIWHALLLFVTFYAQLSGILPPLNNGVSSNDFREPSVLSVAALLFVAVTTMTFSSLNERELRRRKADLESLTETARRLEDVSDPEGVAHILLQGVGEAIGFERGVVLGGPAGTLRLLAHRGPESPVDAYPDHVDQVVETAWRTHETQLVKKLDPEEDPRLNALLPFIENVAVVPLFAEGDPVGVLVVEHGRRSGSRLERRVFSIVSQYALHAALALRNTWLLEEIRRLADTDALTGIANRRIFEHALERELSRAKRNGEPVTLVMIDIDHFKALNDNHGHQMGDEVLRRVAQAIADSCRDFDTPARYGGEEFAVILPACSPTESLVAADRLRTSISAIDAGVPVTGSAGVATFPTHAPDAEALIRAADEALYESKRSGRNRVTRSRRTAPTSRTPLAAPE